MRVNIISAYYKQKLCKSTQKYDKKMADIYYKIVADATAVVQEIGKVRKSLTGLGKCAGRSSPWACRPSRLTSPCSRMPPWGRLTPSLSPPLVRNAGVFFRARRAPQTAAHRSPQPGAAPVVAPAKMPNRPPLSPAETRFPGVKDVLACQGFGEMIYFCAGNRAFAYVAHSYSVYSLHSLSFLYI